MGLLVSLANVVSRGALGHYIINTRKSLIERYFDESKVEEGNMWLANAKDYYVVMNSLRGSTSILDYSQLADFLLLVKASDKEDPMVKLAWKVLEQLHVDYDASELKPISEERYQFLFMHKKAVEAYIYSTPFGKLFGFLSADKKVLLIQE